MKIINRRRHTIHLHHLAAFTLIELLVVVAIIAVLIAILMPGLSSARAQSARVVCTSNMKQLYMAFNYYAEENAGEYPRTWNNWQRPAGSTNERGYWFNKLMGHGLRADGTDEALLSSNPWVLKPGVSNPDYIVSPKLLRCPAALVSSSAGYGLAPGNNVNYGMTNLILWYTGYTPPTVRTDKISRFFTKKLDTPASWPLLMDSLRANIDSLTGTYTYPPDTSLTPRHTDDANVLMADGSFKAMKYQQTLFSEGTLNGSPLPYTKGIK